jgi:hypothetical protein
MLSSGRQRVARLLHAGEAGDLALPFEGRAQGVESGERGVDDLGADAVPGDQSCGNDSGHGVLQG